MTPQERDLITALLDRLQQQAEQPKDAAADTLIRQRLAQLPDAPYLLVQTVLIEDMALHNADDRIKELERQLAAKTAAPPQQPTSFLGRGSVPLAGAAPRPAPAAPTWTQSGAAAPPPAYAQPISGPQMLAGGGGGFLRQAAATAAGIAGGALLFDGIQSLFGGHGGGFLSSAAAQPGLSETVINNYYGDNAVPDTSLDTADSDADQSADFGTDPNADDADVADIQDFDDTSSSSFDV